MQAEDFNKLIPEIHGYAKEAGWWDDFPNKQCDYCLSSDSYTACYCHEQADAQQEFLNDKIDLIAGEGAEAVEALRCGRRKADRDEYEAECRRSPLESPGFFEWHIKDTFPDEIADIAIRTMDLMGFYGWHYITGVEPLPGLGKREVDTKKCLRAIRYHALHASVWNNVTGTNTLNGILDICQRIADLEGFSLEWHILTKLAFNKTRGKKHGGKKF